MESAPDLAHYTPGAALRPSPHTTEAPLDDLLKLLAALSWPEACALLFAENLAILLLALALGHALVRLFGHRRVTQAPEPLRPMEIALTASTLVLNTAVTVAGWWLWREGFITLSAGPWWRVPIDAAVLFGAMDLAMYVLHRIAHLPIFYPWLHRTHHVYTKPRPLTLFALIPAEAVSFGGLWLLVLLVYDATWAGISIYLTLNVLFGLIGHLGVEPLPRRWLELPGLNLLTTSTFHAVHHDTPARNFGFYTAIWDRLFRTLADTYTARFRAAGTPMPPDDAARQDNTSEAL